ncbi:hypothetical protein ACTFIU_011292 [Dictyostelium citrinum]
MDIIFIILFLQNYFIKSNGLQVVSKFKQCCRYNINLTLVFATKDAIFHFTYPNQLSNFKPSGAIKFLLDVDIQPFKYSKQVDSPLPFSEPSKNFADYNSKFKKIVNQPIILMARLSIHIVIKCPKSPSLSLTLRSTAATINRLHRHLVSPFIIGRVFVRLVICSQQEFDDALVIVQVLVQATTTHQIFDQTREESH